VREIELEAARFKQSDEAKVLEGPEAAGRALGELDQSVNGLNEAIGDSGSEEGDDTSAVIADGTSQILEWLQARAHGTRTPPVDGVGVLAGKNILEKFAQAHGAGQGTISVAKAATVELSRPSHIKRSRRVSASTMLVT